MIKPLPDHGEPVHIVLYQEDAAAPDTLVQLWQVFRDENLPSTFWNNGRMLSLAEFVRFFDPSHNRMLFVAIRVGDGGLIPWDDCVGVAWLENMIVGVRAQAHFIIRRKYWGYGRPERVIRQGLRDIFDKFRLQVITCQLHEDNAPALAMLGRLGWHRLGTVPAWFRNSQTNSYRGTVIGYIVPEDIPPREESIRLDNYEGNHVDL